MDFSCSRLRWSLDESIKPRGTFAERLGIVPECTDETADR